MLLKLQKKIDLDFLIDLYKKIDDNQYLDKKIKKKDFKEKFEGIYVSNQEVIINEPKHWITIFNDMGNYSLVDFKTADVLTWDRIIKQLKSKAKPHSFSNGTSDYANRYVLNNCKVETYEPKNGINLSQNSLYNIVVFEK